MAQNVLRYNVVIVGKFFNKGSGVSDAWRENHQEDFDEEYEGHPERIATAQERRDLLSVDHVPDDAVGVLPSGTPPPHGVRPTPAEGEPNPEKQVD